jgi:hypothetical protein
MSGVFKILSLLAVVISSINPASATSGQILTPTGSAVDFTLSYSGTGLPPFVTISDLSFVQGTLVQVGNGFNFVFTGSNLFTSGSFAAFTSNSGSQLPLGTTVRDDVNTTAFTSYLLSYDVNGTPFTTTAFNSGVIPNTFSFAFSPQFGPGAPSVPLPPTFPLFVMALTGLGMIGYHSARGMNGIKTATT